MTDIMRCPLTGATPQEVEDKGRLAFCVMDADHQVSRCYDSIALAKHVSLYATYPDGTVPTIDELRTLFLMASPFVDELIVSVPDRAPVTYDSMNIDVLPVTKFDHIPGSSFRKDLSRLFGRDFGEGMKRMVVLYGNRVWCLSFPHKYRWNGLLLKKTSLYDDIHSVFLSHLTIDTNDRVVAAFLVRTKQRTFHTLRYNILYVRGNASPIVERVYIDTYSKFSLGEHERLVFYGNAKFYTV